jgi:hypothetical protein
MRLACTTVAACAGVGEWFGISSRSNGSDAIGSRAS